MNDKLRDATNWRLKRREAVLEALRQFYRDMDAATDFKYSEAGWKVAERSAVLLDAIYEQAPPSETVPTVVGVKADNAQEIGQSRTLSGMAQKYFGSLAKEATVNDCLMVIANLDKQLSATGTPTETPFTPKIECEVAAGCSDPIGCRQNRRCIEKHGYDPKRADDKHGDPFERWMDYYSPDWRDTFTEGEITPMRNCWKAATALSAIGAPSAIPRILEWLENEDKDNDPDDLYSGRSHRVAAIRAIVEASNG